MEYIVKYKTVSLLSHHTAKYVSQVCEEQNTMLVPFTAAVRMHQVSINQELKKSRQQTLFSKQVSARRRSGQGSILDGINGLDRAGESNRIGRSTSLV